MPKLISFKRSTPPAARQDTEPTDIELQEANAPIASSSSVSSTDNVHTSLFSRKDAALAAFQGVISAAQPILQAANVPVASSVLASVAQIIKLAGVSLQLYLSVPGTNALF